MFERERIKEFTDDELRVFTEAANTVERMLHGPGAVKQISPVTIDAEVVR